MDVGVGVGVGGWMGVTECGRELSLHARVRAGVFVCVRVRVYVRNLQLLLRIAKLWSGIVMNGSCRQYQRNPFNF